jgi:hypothetical protein
MCLGGFAVLIGAGRSTYAPTMRPRYPALRPNVTKSYSTQGATFTLERRCFALQDRDWQIRRKCCFNGRRRGTTHSVPHHDRPHDSASSLSNGHGNTLRPNRPCCRSITLTDESSRKLSSVEYTNREPMMFPYSGHLPSYC